MKKIEHVLKIFIISVMFVALTAGVVFAKSDLKLEYGSLQCSVVDGEGTTFYKDDVIRVEVEVANAGSDKAPSSRVEFYADKRKIGALRLGPINSGRTKQAAMHWITDGPGDYKIRVVVDPDDDIDEEGEMNNELHKFIKILDQSKEQ